MLVQLLAAAGFRRFGVRVRAANAHFTVPDDFASSYSPIFEIDPTRTKSRVEEMGQALRGHVNEQELPLPMGAHIAGGTKQLPI